MKMTSLDNKFLSNEYFYSFRTALSVLSIRNRDTEHAFSSVSCYILITVNNDDEKRSISLRHHGWAISFILMEF
jgi:hypothetical protein